MTKNPPTIQTAWIPAARPANAKSPTRLSVDEVELCDDTIPANRITSVQSKYMPYFEGIRANNEKKCIKCHPGAVGSIANGLRKYLERRGEKGKFAIKSVSNYGDGRGRVWLLPAKP